MMSLKRLNIMNLLKKLIILILLILVVYLKKATVMQKLIKLNRKFLIMIMLKILTQENFSARLTQENLASKNDFANIAKKKTYFDHKLKTLQIKKLL